MEPPSPILADRDYSAGALSDDPLSRNISADAFLIISRSLDTESDEGFFVCSYSAHEGLSYIGHTSPLES